jgi:hypothetical protein
MCALTCFKWGVAADSASVETFSTGSCYEPVLKVLRSGARQPATWCPFTTGEKDPYQPVLMPYFSLVYPASNQGGYGWFY